MGRASSVAAAKTTSDSARLQLLLADPRGRPIAGGWDDRKLVCLDAAQLGLVATGLDAQRGRAVGLEIDPFARGQTGDDDR